MYTTCIFCNHSLLRNEALEHFPVGRRLAYDPARGRLWAVCLQCERWNLTPLETRWEAIEEAERLFRSSPLRIATDNIGLAALREGTELVRIGRPPTLELAGWRYGDQFGRRRRRTITRLVLGAGVLGGSLLFLPFTSAGLLSVGANLLHQVGTHWYLRRYRCAAAAGVYDDDGNLLVLSQEDARGSALIRSRGPAGGWVLKLPRRDAAGGDATMLLQRRRTVKKAGKPVLLAGETAQRALAKLIPYANMDGASGRRVREAVGVIAESRSIGALIDRASAEWQFTNVVPGENLLAGLAPPIRLALEMALHDETEERAMNGQLGELEARWREAEEIAAIADSLLVPAEVEQRLARMREMGGSRE